MLSQAGEAFLGGAQRRFERDGFAEGLEEVVRDGAVPLQFGRLLVEPDAAPPGPCDGTGVGVLVGGDQAQKRRLAGAVAAHENGVVVGIHSEAHGGEKALSTKGFLDVVEGDDAHGRRRPCA